jgi:ABC-type multidrug transport system fused ATPase/permease subunit
MEVGLLLKLGIGLIVVLMVLIAIFLLPKKIKSKKTNKANQKQETKSQVPKKQEEKVLSLDELIAIVKNKSSTTKELDDAINQIIKHYAKIPPKMGIRSHPDFDKYVKLVVYLVRHRNTNKDLVLKLDRALVKNNPEYKAELNDTLNKALNSRG